MMAMPVDRVRFAVVCLAVTGVGCTRSDDVGEGEVDFDLPQARFSVSSAANNSRWRAVPPEGIPNVLCSGPAALTDNCCQPPAPSGSPEPTINVDCQRYPLSCDAAGWCALAFEYDDQTTIDLGGSVPALHERRGWVLANADLAVLKTRIDRKDLPIESAALYVAPQGVLSPQAPASRFLTAIPLEEEETALALDAEARLALSTFLTDFNTPFTLILAVNVAIEAQHTRIDKPEWTPGETATAWFTFDGRVRARF